MFMSSLSLAWPEVVLMAASCALLVWGAFQGKATALFNGVAILSLITAAWLAMVGPHGTAFAGGLIADPISAFAKVFIYGFTAVSILLTDRWLARRGEAKFELTVLMLLAALGMGVMASAGDLISLYMGIELHSLALYVLAAFRRDDAKGSEAGLKYFVLGALSSGLLLYGASLIYGFAGSTQFPVIAEAVKAGGAGAGVLFGLVFLICGIAFKVSAAPFHMWTPDVYEGAPTPIVGFFSAAPKLAAMVLLARVLNDAFGTALAEWRQVIVAIAMMSIFVGAFAGLAQRNLKRLWAYSSIANIGYALLGLAAGGEAGTSAMLLFMVLYMVDVTGFFAILCALQRDGRPMETIDDMAGLVKERPGLALGITALSLSALGLPPFAGFWAKIFVFQTAIGAAGPSPWVAPGPNAYMAWAAVLGLVGSVVAAFYYLRLIKVMWMDPSPGATEKPPLEARTIGILGALFSFPVCIVALIWLEPLAKAAAAALG